MSDVRHATAPQLPSFRISLRELLLLVAFAALAIVSIRYASYSWRTAVYTITMIVFMAGAVVALIDRGPRQAFAIGMVLIMVIYAVLVRNGVSGELGNNRELSPGAGRLPTTRLSSYFYRPEVTEQWYDRRTGNLLPNLDPNSIPPGVTARLSTTSNPPRELFMQIVHSWWALLLGYIGGLFARIVYVRRNKENAAAPSA